ncbi:MAG TPA: hypothetical protein ACFYEA_05645, partial [Candidatus Tripitaka californicus]|uniref:hypothetical protein n=1 Tax=Candidatus Tripitaka californicus TaxID=3367616 RepID=UPI00402565AB
MDAGEESSNSSPTVGIPARVLNTLHKEAPPLRYLPFWHFKSASGRYLNKNISPTKTLCVGARCNVPLPGPRYVNGG